MATDSAKLDRYRLETEFNGDDVIHTSYTSDLQTGQRQIEVKEKWSPKRKIGAGGFGVVWLQESQYGQLRAVKKLPGSAGIVDQYSRELATLAKLKDYHSLFVQLIGWYADSDSIFLAMEYIEHGDLGRYIKTGGPPLDAREITRQVLEGLVVLHERQICHRDLKPKNVLVASFDPIWVKIADFGVSKREKNTLLNTSAGTNGYCAPEILRLLPRRFRSRNSYTNAVDMWALGCMVHEILTTSTPFLESDLESTMFSDLDICEPQTDMDLISRYCSGRIEFPVTSLENVDAGPEAIDFICKLLFPDPTKRLSAPEALRHPWLSEVFRQAGTIHRSSSMMSGPASPLMSGPASPRSMTSQWNSMISRHPPAEEDSFLLSCHNRLVHYVSVEKPGLATFFPGDLEEVLRPYSQRAGAFALQLVDHGCTPDVARALGVLTLYDLAMIIDDGESMKYDESGARIPTLTAFLSIIIEIYTLSRPSGVSIINFINSPSSLTNVTPKGIDAIISNCSFTGFSRVGTELHRKILVPHVLGKSVVMQKPLLVFVVTDGCIGGEKQTLLQEVATHAINTLIKQDRTGPNSVAFKFACIGSDTAALGLLKSTAEHQTVSAYADCQLASKVLCETETEKRWIEISKMFLGALLPSWKYEDLEFDD